MPTYKIKSKKPEMAAAAAAEAKENTSVVENSRGNYMVNGPGVYPGEVDVMGVSKADMLSGNYELEEIPDPES